MGQQNGTQFWVFSMWSFLYVHFLQYAISLLEVTGTNFILLYMMRLGIYYISTF